MHLSSDHALWAITLAVTFSAGWLDGFTHRIPNWLTVSGLLAGVLVHAIPGGRSGLIFAVEGAGLGLALLLPLVLLRALGAGDWKLMGALGALVGPQMLCFVLFSSVLVAGIMAVFMMVRAHRVRDTFQHIGPIIVGLLTSGFKAHPDISLDNPGVLKLPFGVAAAIGTLICFVAAHWLV